MSVVYKSMRLDSIDQYLDKKNIPCQCTGKDLVDDFFRCCINRDFEERTLKVLENFCDGIGYDENCYFGCYFCTELYDSGISRGNKQEMEPYLRWRLENKAPDLYLDYFGEEGVLLWFSELSFVSKNYNVFLTHDEFLQEAKRHYGKYVKERPLQREKINALLQRLENSFEEAKRRKRGFSMTRREAERIIRREGLQHYHVGSAREDRVDEIVLKEEEGLWHVYQTDENGDREPEYDHVFILEGDAWAFLVCWLREREKGRSGLPMSRQEAEEVIQREGLLDEVQEDGNSHGGKVAIRKEGRIWHVSDLCEGDQICKDRIFTEEKDAWANYVEQLWKKKTNYCSIPKEVRRPCWEKKQRVLMHPQIYSLIRQVDFSEAEKLFWQLSHKEQVQALNHFLFNQESMVIYAFLQYLLEKRESTFLHEMAYDMLISSLCHVEGSFEMALYHNRRLLELEPDSLEYMEWMLSLSYYDIIALGWEQTYYYVMEVLKHNPDSYYAKSLQDKILSSKDALRDKEREERVYLRPRENITYQKLFYHIMKVEFSKAETVFLPLSEPEKREIIRKMSLDMESMILYKFLQCLNEKEESTLLHELEWEILTGVMHEVEGAYQMALYHNQRLLKLEPDSVKYREYILTLYDAAQVIDRERAERIAREILERDESNRMARELLDGMECQGGDNKCVKQRV